MVNTINPADCGRTTVYAGECRNFQDTEWIRFNSGRRRSPNAHDGNTWLIDVAHGSFWMTDDQVRNLVRLVPARPITRDDLPWLTGGAVDQVVERLNASGWLPASREDATLAARLERQSATIGELQGDVARLRRAHSIVEGERDQAREQWKKWEHKANEAEREVSTWRTSTESAHSDFLQAAHDRDEAVARAEAAEARLADPYSQAHQDAAAWKRVAEHPALRMDLLPEADHTYAGGVFERITWLAETAEAVAELKPAPAVTREDVIDALTVGIRGTTDGDLIDQDVSIPSGECVRLAVDAACDLFGVESGQATDPVEDKARELAKAGGVDFDEQEPEGVEMLIGMARHVLGQDTP